MKEIRVETEINSTPDRVWSLLVDSSGFVPDEIRGAVKEGRIGAKLRVFMKTEGGRGGSFTVKLLKAEPVNELRWKGRLWISGLFDGEHVFEITRLQGRPGVVFVQRERFSGLLLPFLAKTLRDTKDEFDRMAGLLKLRAEEAAA